MFWNDFCMLSCKFSHNFILFGIKKFFWGQYLFNALSPTFLHSCIPTFLQSIIPSFQYFIIPSFHHSIIGWLVAKCSEKSCYVIPAVFGSLLEMAENSSICDELNGSHMSTRNHAMWFQRYLVVCWKCKNVG